MNAAEIKMGISIRPAGPGDATSCGNAFDGERDVERNANDRRRSARGAPFGMYGGLSILSLLTQHSSGFVDNPFGTICGAPAMHTQAFIWYCRS